MWPFSRRNPAEPTIQPPSDASRRVTDYLREVAERLAVVEGEVNGLKASQEMLAESLQKLSNKWTARTRREADRAEKQDPEEDPRITALKRRRGLRA